MTMLIFSFGDASQLYTYTCTLHMLHLYTSAVHVHVHAHIHVHLYTHVHVHNYIQVCFYKRRKKGEIGVGPHNTLVCKICRDHWESVVVIPASTLCWNFGDFELLPIAPWPRSKPNNSPFEYCQKDDHYRYM